MIDSVNGLSLPSVSGPTDSTTTPSGEDPMAQIAQILSSHLESLQWIDGAVREVEGKVTEVEKQITESGVASPSLNGGGMKSRGFGINR
jgi:nuclear pore complex protein Nup62